MLRLTLFTIIFFFSSGCKSTTETPLLNEFKEIIDIPKDISECLKSFDIYNEMHGNNLISFLGYTNEITDTLLNRNLKYYYGFKKKINNQCYLLAIKRVYSTLGQYTNVLLAPYDVIFCLYNKEKKSIQSRLIVIQSEPILRHFKYKNGIFTVNSGASYFQKLDTENATVNRVMVEQINEYVIVDDHFESKL